MVMTASVRDYTPFQIWNTPTALLYGALERAHKALRPVA